MVKPKHRDFDEDKSSKRRKVLIFELHKKLFSYMYIYICIIGKALVKVINFTASFGCGHFQGHNCKYNLQENSIFIIWDQLTCVCQIFSPYEEGRK